MHSSVDGHLHHFPYLSFMNNTAMNIGVKCLFQSLLSLGVELLNYMVILSGTAKVYSNSV